MFTDEAVQLLPVLAIFLSKYGINHLEALTILYFKTETNMKNAQTCLLYQAKVGPILI